MGRRGKPLKKSPEDKRKLLAKRRWKFLDVLNSISPLPRRSNVLNYSSILAASIYAGKNSKMRLLLLAQLEIFQKEHGCNACGLLKNDREISFTVPLGDVIGAIKSGRNVTLIEKKYS